MIAVHDIGQDGALAFTDAARFKNFELDIAGDGVTMPEAPRRSARGWGGRSTTSRSRSPTCARTAKMSR